MTKARYVKNKELHELWKRHMESWSVSGLSQTEYCRQNDLSRDRFNYWKRKFNPKNLPVEFVQITPESMGINLPGLKLNIGLGLQVEIPNGFSQATLEQVLATLKVLR